MREVVALGGVAVHMLHRRIRAEMQQSELDAVESD
jgi:hypothetical protein